MIGRHWIGATALFRSQAIVQSIFAGPRRSAS
jgi:hypothetical protein